MANLSNEEIRKQNAIDIFQDAAIDALATLLEKTKANHANPQGAVESLALSLQLERESTDADVAAAFRAIRLAALDDGIDSMLRPTEIAALVRDWGDEEIRCLDGGAVHLDDPEKMAMAARASVVDGGKAFAFAEPGAAVREILGGPPTAPNLHIAQDAFLASFGKCVANFEAFARAWRDQEGANAALLDDVAGRLDGLCLLYKIAMRAKS